MSDEIAVARDAFAEAPLLRGASPYVVDQLSASTHERRLRAREWLFHEGDAADELYVVLSAGSRSSTTTGACCARSAPGAALGELGLLTGTERSASVRAVRDSRLLVLDAESFVRLLELDSGFALAVARELARQLQASGGLELPRDEAVGVRDRRGRLGRCRAASRPSSRSRSSASAASSRSTAATSRRRTSRPCSKAPRRSSTHVLLLDEPRRAGASSVGASATGCSSSPQARRRPRSRRSSRGASSCSRKSRRRRSSAGSTRLRPRAHHVLPAGEPRATGAASSGPRLTQRSLGVVLSGGGARGLRAHRRPRRARRGRLRARPDRRLQHGLVHRRDRRARPFADEIETTCRDELVRRSPFNDYTLPRVSLIRSRKAGAMLQRVFGGLLVEELARPLHRQRRPGDEPHRRPPARARHRAVGASMIDPGDRPADPARGAAARGRRRAQQPARRPHGRGRRGADRGGRRRSAAWRRPRKGSRRCRRSRRRSRGRRCSARSSGRSGTARSRSCSSRPTWRRSSSATGLRSTRPSRRGASPRPPRSRTAARTGFAPP